VRKLRQLSSQRPVPSRGAAAQGAAAPLRCGAAASGSSANCPEGVGAHRPQRCRDCGWGRLRRDSVDAAAPACASAAAGLRLLSRFSTARQLRPTPRACNLGPIRLRSCVEMSLRRLPYGVAVFCWGATTAGALDWPTGPTAIYLLAALVLIVHVLDLATGCA